LYWYNSRWYDPALGRFVQPDSIIPSQTDPLSWDRYCYTLNNPVRYNDPSGHCPWCVVIGAVVGAAVGYGAQVVNNYQNDVANPWTTNISAEAILGGAVAGATVGLGVGVVSVLAGGGAAAVGGAGAATGGTVLAANNACGGDLCTSEAQDVGTNISLASTTIGQVSTNTSTAIQTYYPPNLGFAGTPQVTSIQPGELVSRYGSTYGSFLSPANTPTWARSLPPGVANTQMNVYQVVKPIENVLGGKIASWWGEIGGGYQYYINSPYGQNVQSLLDSGHLMPYAK
jgi:hypothetical protein